jgi:pyridoxamine 5'-phosphate oxidase
MINSFLNSVRRDFSGKDLSIENTPSFPFDLFENWFDEAVEAEVLDPNAMNLATVDDKGQPSLRVVLLKNITNAGLSFFTDYDSQKGVEMLSNHQVAINFFWVELMRQVRVLGRVEKVSREESVTYFNSRPFESRISAIASDQSQSINKEDLENRINELVLKYPDQNPPCPNNWGGYIVKPHLFEFWQGKPSRLHDRVTYKKEGSVWLKDRVAP